MVNNQTASAPICYARFYDIPREFLAMYRGIVFLFEDVWNEVEGGDSEIFDIYTVKDAKCSDLRNPDGWNAIVARRKHITSLPIKAVTFDETRRKSISAALLDEIIEKFGLESEG